MPATPFQKEAWTEYGIGVVILFVRLFARHKVVGIRSWQGDDYFTIVALAFWTAELTMLEMIGQLGTNIGLSEDQRITASDEMVAQLVSGSKCLMAGWTCYVSLIWSLKTCMLFFYSRLTLGLVQEKLVKICAVACACTYVGVILTIFLHCRPLHKHFQVYPDPGKNCTADTVNYIVIAVTNVMTDAMLLSIPLPLLIKLAQDDPVLIQRSSTSKMLIGVLLCGGIFIMAATLLRCILSLQDIKQIDTSTIWAIRETFVAIIAVNAPCIKPLFSSATWIGSTRETSKNQSGYPTGDSQSTSVFGRYKNRTKPSQLGSVDTNPGRASDEFILHDRGNQTQVNGTEESLSDEEGRRQKDGIQVTTMYEVRRDH